MPSSPRWISGCLFTGVALYLVAACALAQQTYPLDAGDRVRVMVHERPDLSGTYTVGASGEVSIPLLGRVLARGRDERALESALADLLAARQSVPPHVAVEVEAYRPVFVDGDVAKAGAYAFAPGLTVRDALALAGGRLSLRNASSYDAVDRAREEQTLATLVDSYIADVVREARLVSERDSRKAVEIPEEVAARENEKRMKEVVASESRMFETRLALVNGQSALLSERILQYGRQIGELRGERVELERKRELTQKKLDAMQELVSKGATARLDLLQMEINSTESARELRENSVLTLDATLGRNEAQQTTENLRSQRAAAVAAELVEVRNRLSNNLIRIRSVAKRLHLMAGEGEAAASDSGEPSFRISRRDGDAWVEVPASLDTPLRPADALFVPFPALDRNAPPERLGLPRRIQDPEVEDKAQ